MSKKKKKNRTTDCIVLIVDGRQYSALQCTCMGRGTWIRKIICMSVAGIQHVIPT